MIEYFKAEDFIGSDGAEHIPFWAHNAAFTVNKKLQELIDAAPMMYGQVGIEFIGGFSPVIFSSDTHKARLMFIEPIKKECVKHEPGQIYSDINNMYSKCKHCGVDLVPEWRAK